METPHIYIPGNFSGIAVPALANDLNNKFPNKPEALILDFQHLRFIEPCGVVFLSNLIHWLNQHGCRVQLDGMNIQRDSIKYLDDSLFFEQHYGSKLIETSSPRSTTRPLQRIGNTYIHSWLDFDLVPWLASRLNLTAPSLYSLRAVISEIFNNIKDHTRLEIGSIFVQHFPRSNEIRIAVADFGHGIPTSVRTKIPDIPDARAIVKATEEGFTTKSTPANQGAGLSYLLDIVAKGNGGAVTIYSLYGIVKFARRAGLVAADIVSENKFCPGTTIEIVLRTDTIERLPEEREELQW